MRHNSVIGFAALLLLALAAAGALAVLGARRDGDAGETPRASGLPYEIEGYAFSHTLGGPLVPTSPVDIAVGEGRIYVADIGLNRVLAFTPDGALDTGWGEAGMSERLLFPSSVALGPGDELYVLQLGDAVVHQLDDQGRSARSWNVGGSDGQAGASLPTALTVGDDGMVYVPDQRARQIRRYDPNGEELDAWNLPLDLADDGDIWVRDISAEGARILVSYQLSEGGSGLLAYDQTGQAEEMEGPLDAPAPDGGGRSPASIAVDRDGQIAIVHIDDSGERPPLVVTAAGSWEPEGASSLAPINGLIPPGIAFDEQGRILLADPGRQAVHIYAPDGSPAGALRSADATGLLAGLDEIVAGPDGLLYAADPLRGRVLAYTPEGAVERTYQLPGDAAEGVTTGFTRLRMRVAVDGQGYVYVLDEFNGQITRFTPEGELDTANWAGQSGEEGQAAMLLAAGADRIYVVGFEEQDRLLVLSPEGENLGPLFEPFGDSAIQDIAVTPDRIYTVELGAGNSPVRAYTPDGAFLGELTDLSRGDSNENRTGFSLAPDGRGGLLIAAVNVRSGPEFEYQLLRLDPDGDLERLGTLDIPFTTLPDLAVDAAGRLYVAAPNDQQIYVYDSVVE